jgi:hypothetical protein
LIIGGKVVAFFADLADSVRVAGVAVIIEAGEAFDPFEIVG